MRSKALAPTVATIDKAYHRPKQARVLAHERNSLRQVGGRTDSTSADTAPASIVSVDDQVNVGAPHCSGYGKRSQGVVCSTLSCARAHPLCFWGVLIAQFKVFACA